MEKPEKFLLKTLPVLQLREAAGLNQTELAEKLGMTQSRIGQMERREKAGKPMQMDTLKKVALACGYDIRVIARKAQKKAKKKGKSRRAA